jgi:hypothetical protein
MTSSAGTTPFLPGVLRQATEIVYHYTSAQGLLGIIGNNSLWASEASSMNDIAEIDQGWLTIERLLKDKANSEARDKLLMVPDWARRRPAEVFLLSASARRDDANQWQNYADHGRGYALGLDPKGLLAVRSWAEEPGPEEGLPTPSPPLIDFAGAVFVSPWRHVVYDEDAVSSALDELIEEVPRIRQRIHLAPTEEDYVQQAEIEWISLWQSLEAVAHLYKPAGFSGENEVRATVTAIAPAAHVHFRSGSNGIISYVNLTSPPDRHASVVRRKREHLEPPMGALPIVEVMLGPGLPRVNLATVERLLDAHDLPDVRVSRSTLSLR